jgi:hypothetical protein
MRKKLIYEQVDFYHWRVVFSSAIRASEDRAANSSQAGAASSN